MVPVYMAFPDGVFHYACRECTLVCCYRSDQFDGSFEREIKTLVQFYPALELVATRRRGDVVTFSTPSGRCYFLGGDSLCSIEKDHGKENKPTACRIFPFNHFSRIGKAIAVSPNFLCPLRVEVPARPGQAEGTHSAVESSLRRSPYLDDAYLSGFPRLALNPEVSAASVLTREEAFRDSCSQALGRHTFAETVRAASPDPEGMEAFVGRAAALLGLDAGLRPPERDSTDDLMLALAPTLRLNMLHLTSEQILRGLELSELLLRRVMQIPEGLSMPAGPADISKAKGAYEVLAHVGPALRLLARSDERIEMPLNAVKKIPAFGQPDMTFAAFKLLRSSAGSEVLIGTLEGAMSLLSSVSDRMAFLVEMGSQIETTLLGRKRKRNGSDREAAGR